MRFHPEATHGILDGFDLIRLAQGGDVHFMGIGGAGMAPLADLVRRAGGRVTGCDTQAGKAAGALKAAGVAVHEGHAPEHVEGAAALVVTSAVPADHPEVLAARERGIPVVKRAEALGSIVNRGTVVGIAGTHGKTTTTALATSVLVEAGLDPTGLVGGRVPAWEGNLRRGGDEVFIVEADEYDRSFHHLRPTVAVVTTLEADHLDIYGSLAGVEEAFRTFVDLVPEDGLVAGCADDHGAARLMAALRRPEGSVLTYGTSAGSMLRAEDVRLSGAESAFTVRERGRELGEVRLRAPGLHNVQNALAAVAAGLHFGAPWERIAAGLAAYGGVERRFEHVGEAGGVKFVDDYAHHPTEVAATIRAARGAYPDRRIVAVFQPHLYSRTRDFAGEFARALALADLTFVTDIYAAREAPIPGVSGEILYEAVSRAGGEARYIPDRDRVVEVVADSLRPGDLCLTLGAGNLDEAARQMVSLLAGSSSSL